MTFVTKNDRCDILCFVWFEEVVTHLTHVSFISNFPNLQIVITKMFEVGLEKQKYITMEKYV